jgi:diadenylate cyclase
VMLNKVEEPTSAGNAVIRLKIVRELEKETHIENRSLEMEPMPLGTIGQIRMIIRKAVDEGIVVKGDNIIVLADETLGIGFDGLFLFFKIDEKFMEMTTRELKKELKKSVFDSVMEIARELGREGREGKKIGTAFIIGDHDKVLVNSRQMILNPLEGHPFEKRNVTDVGLKETIKALAQLDGAFVVDSEGYIHAAGRYLDADTDGVNLQGLGCRHTACAAITKISDAVAVVVSESGGIVRVFRGGNLISEEKG